MCYPPEDERLLEAVLDGNVVALRAMCSEGERFDPLKIEKYELLHHAAITGNLETLTVLLSHGGGKFIDQFDELGHTPLFWAAKHGYTSLVHLLLSAGANVNAHKTDMIGNTVLREVIDNCNFEIAQALIAAGADPNLKGWMQLSALDVAKSRYLNERNKESKRIINLLLCASERTEAKNQAGRNSKKDRHGCDTT